MATARRCSGCGASLGAPTDDDLTVVCRFCGLRHDLNDLGAPPTVVVALGSTARRANGLVVMAVLGIVAIAVGFSMFTAYRATEGIKSTVAQTAAAVQQRVAERNRPLAVDELATLIEPGWKTVTTPPPPGGFAAFEPVSALPWATALGHAWAADAVVTRIDVGRVAATGAVDLSGEDTSGYRFTSAARRRRWQQDTDTGAKSPAGAGLLLQVQGTTVKVLVQNDSRDEPPAPLPASLPLPQILERARRGRGFADRPFYAGYMIHLPREGWVWYFRAPSGDGFPRVRARDGRVYPY